MDDATPAIAAMRDAWARVSGRRPTVAARAPGRVNLIGEHTDYSEGLVLPGAIDRATTVLGARGAPGAPGRVRVHALDLGETAEFDPEQPVRRGDWLDYVQGIAFAMRERGLSPPAVELAVSSEVPMGAGLSSSAALGVSVAAAWCRLAEADAAPVVWAEIAHRAENAFVATGCGILDHYASALGRAGHALRIDCRSRDVVPVAIRDARLVVLLAHSGVERQLAREGGYRARVEECAAAFAAARAAGLLDRSARTLRDVPVDALPELERRLEPTLFRRARHVVLENDRVDLFCAALAADDRAGLGTLLRASQASLRDDFEVSCAELDHLCEVTDGLPGVVGSRLTGAGFGGCTLHLIEAGQADAIAEAQGDAFARRFGRRPRPFVARLGDGASVRSL